MTNETLSLRDRANAFDQVAVDAMVADITASLARRDVFEAANGLALDQKNSYTDGRAVIVKYGNQVARTFLALSLTPANVFERKVQSTKMFNAKALKKVAEVAAYICGDRTKIELVVRAFLCCSIIATERGVDVITNDINKRFLNNASFGALIKDKKLQSEIAALRHKFMSGGAETQSSQARNVLDVLGVGSIMTTHHARDSIKLNRDHDFVKLFSADYLTSVADKATA